MQQMKEIRSFNGFEDSEKCASLLDECFDVMEDADSYFEDLRSDNDTLRKWGTEMEQEAETLQVQVNELLQQIESLQDELNHVKS